MNKIRTLNSSEILPLGLLYVTSCRIIHLFILCSTIYYMLHLFMNLNFI